MCAGRRGASYGLRMLLFAFRGGELKGKGGEKEGKRGRRRGRRRGGRRGRRKGGGGRK